jgi:hypothetical protein
MEDKVRIELSREAWKALAVIISTINFNSIPDHPVKLMCRELLKKVMFRVLRKNTISFKKAYFIMSAGEASAFYIAISRSNTPLGDYELALIYLIINEIEPKLS